MGSVLLLPPLSFISLRLVREDYPDAPSNKIMAGLTTFEEAQKRVYVEESGEE